MEQVVERINNSLTFAIQLNESTHKSCEAQVLMYVRYIFNGQFEESMLFCRSLKSNATSAEIYKVISEFFDETKLSW